MNGFEKDVKKILTENGWSLLRSAKGSHEYWGKKGMKPVTVPHGCRSRHTANAVMKAAKINHKF
ncbi:type II toxin-antitoxin system HicA family toxin [Methylophaga sp.]|uniref:type II toxin-antitoxin system HicA family toxin n=1 Tax=Methylophaga sp. TaxID=2024840 RepID=UPI001400C38C|nr:type II toxin-antitoxin system HicA family toxin [Methylophaga sp.]